MSIGAVIKGAVIKGAVIKTATNLPSFDFLQGEYSPR